MTTVPESPETVVERIGEELAAGLGVVLTGLGVRCGLWAALRGAGPLTAAEAARRTGLIEPYVREWLRAQAAGGYLSYDPDGDRFALPEPVAVALLDGPCGAMVDACLDMFGSITGGLPAFQEAFRAGRGFGWHERDVAHWRGTDALTRVLLPPGILAAAVSALDGVPDALRAGSSVADVGCGYGAPTIMVAEAFPSARVTGFDYHDTSVDAARTAAAAAGVADRVRFEVATATDFPGGGYALVLFVDSLHDLGDPVGALAHARAALAPDGAVLLVEPPGGDRVADNLTPVGRMFYAVSTLVCTPNAVSQDVGAPSGPLGTLAGEPRLAEVARAAGFRQVRRVPTEAPMNLVLELRG